MLLKLNRNTCEILSYHSNILDYCLANGKTQFTTISENTPYEKSMV